MDFGFKCLFSLVLLLVELLCVVNGNVVFQVQHKYGSKGKFAGLRELRAHDTRRHGRMLAAVDLELGGDGSPTNAALYYTRITIGSPPVDYHVQVDTGSDILWINCKDCQRCPTRSDLHIPLRQYDLTASSSGQTVTCDQDFCDAASNGPNPDCQVGSNCEYSVTYGDGSRTQGYFVRDLIRLNQVSGDLQTRTVNSSIAFGKTLNLLDEEIRHGMDNLAPVKKTSQPTLIMFYRCSGLQSGELGSSAEAVDGIIGFGQANTSVLSQLSSSGRVKKIFSHCLDSSHGGGIFAMGEVVQPKFNRTPLVPNAAHYNVILKAVEVGGHFLDLPTDAFDTVGNRGTIIDSGTTLAYLPSDVYQHIVQRTMAQQPKLKTHTVQDQFKCFWYTGNIDEGFPVVNFHFDQSLSLPVYPHNYLFEVQKTEYCIGWQTSGMQTRDGREMTLLGDIVLSDKLVVYDLENQTIGWTEYNCSSSIKLRDEATGSAYAVTAHDISSAFSLPKVNMISFLLLIIVLVNVQIG